MTFPNVRVMVLFIFMWVQFIFVLSTVIHPKTTIHIYSPSCCLKPIWCFGFYWNLKRGILKNLYAPIA